MAFNLLNIFRRKKVSGNAVISTKIPNTSDRFNERPERNNTFEDTNSVTNKQNEVYQKLYNNHSLPFNVGIDIGNTCTKIAFSLSDDKSDPTRQILSINGLSSNTASSANPTVVLLNDNEQFKSFGADAIYDYGENEQGHLFREVKQPLYSYAAEEVKYIRDELGRKTPAVKVLSEIIKHIKGKIISILGFSNVTHEIWWVITVPAVFTEQAINIVRTAALMAGIMETDLRIVLEPEAALEYCFIAHKYAQIFKPEITDGHTTLPDRKQFMVVDIGEETLDVTVIEKDKFGTLKELYKLCGVGYGGKILHRAIDNLFTTIFGPEAYQRFRTEKENEYRQLHTNFIEKLKNEDSNSTENIRVFASGLLIIYSEEEHFKDALKKSPFAGEISIAANILKIPAEVWQGLLGEYACHITYFMKDVFTKQECVENMCVLLVGGYAELRITHETFTREFPNIEILIPSEPQYATVKGAVLLGHKPPSKIERAGDTIYTIKTFENGKVKDNDGSPLQRQACGSDFVQSIREMAEASDFLGDVVVHSLSKFQAGITSLQQKMAGKPQKVCVKRKDIITDAITAYRNIDVHRPLKVHFAGEGEKDVTIEMFGLFWEKISSIWFQGENVVIPLVPVAKRAEARHVFPVLGKILEHTLCILGHFPPQICRSLLFAIAHPDKDVDADLVLEDYLLYLPERESELLKESLKQTELSANTKKRLERFFSVNGFSLQPTPSSLKENLLNVAYAEIIDSSHVYMSLMGRGISDFAKAHVFNVLDTDTLKAEYTAREVTAEKVAQMIEAMLDKTEYSLEEKKIINYASNFVSDLSKKQLRQFLTWLTGSSNMPQKIEIIFNTSRGLTRTPTVHRNKNMLELSRDYQTYQDFKQEIMDVFLTESSIGL